MAYHDRTQGFQLIVTQDLRTTVMGCEENGCSVNL